MTDVYYSRVLDVPAASAWNMVRDFGGLSKWFPFIPQSVLRAGAAATEVGAVRDNTNDKGEVISEQLVAFSDRDRSFTYNLIAGDVPMKEYTSTLWIHEVTEDGRTFAVWTARYEPTGDAAETADWVRNGIFQTCLARLEEVLKSSVSTGSGPAQSCLN